ncbi:MAG: alpha-L-glutamate ligase-like protein [Woeseiaceae bacterium]
MMFVSPGRLRKLGIVGMNNRNINLIGELNPRHLYPLVDNKLKTKLLAAEKGLATPALIGALRTQHDVQGLESFLEPHDGFAIKPAKGSGGKGILVIAARREEFFVKPNGQELPIDEIRRHASNILSGLFSLGGTPDLAVVEELIKPHAAYKNLSVEGVPDIRVIVYRGFPIMAMMRLSTRESDGKANLHQGAIGVGLTISSGRPVNATQFNRRVVEHPDSGADLMSIQISDWPDLLEIAARSADVTGLGYLGSDIVVDRRYGPLLLELNARPGLAIQLANNCGLSPRIRAIDNLTPACFRQGPKMRVDRAIEMFD